MPSWVSTSPNAVVEQLAIGAASDAGRVRPKNEDYVLWG